MILLPWIQTGRLYRPREFWLAFKWNLWIFCQAVLIGNPGLDPEQEGDHYVFAKRDYLTLFLLPAFFFIGFSIWFPILVWFLSPWFICATCELGEQRERTGRLYRGPRIHLPRWYVSILGVVLMFCQAPAWIRWGIVVYWAISAVFVADCYRSDWKFYAIAKRQNPNRNHYQIANLAFILLREGKHYQAEEEFEDVLKRDPLNFRAGYFVEMFKRNRSWTEAGIAFVSFLCLRCSSQAGRLLRDGDTLTPAEHAMFLSNPRKCNFCGNIQEFL